jgi:hypothetical protein
MSLHRWAAIKLLSACALIAAPPFASNDTADLGRKVDQVFAAYDKPDSPRAIPRLQAAFSRCG